MKLELNNGHIFTYQTPATLNQAAPVQNTWYTILDTTSNVAIYGIAGNVEDTNEDLDFRITIDGETLTGQVSATHSTNYYAMLYLNAIPRTDSLSITATWTTALHGTPIFQGKSIKVEIRKTTAAGAGNLTGIVAYGVLEAI